MIAKAGETIIANSDNTVEVENNYYFPPNTVKQEYLQQNSFHTTCPWRGHANYFDISVNDKLIENGAWTYPVLKNGAADTIGVDFSGFIAFDRSLVEVVQNQ